MIVKPIPPPEHADVKDDAEHERDPNDAVGAEKTTTRCGVPDQIMSGPHGFAHLHSSWPSSTISWRTIASGDASKDALLVQASREAFAAWQVETDLTFVEKTSGAVEIELAYGPVAKESTIAQADSPGNGGDVTVSEVKKFAVGSSIPSDAYDLTSTLIHELGHSLGLDHSAREQSIMYPWSGTGPGQRTFDADDIVAISALYDQWTLRPGTAVDIDVGADGSIWAVGTAIENELFGLYRWDGTDWRGAGGSGLRVAVEPGGVPWTINIEGEIYRRTSASVETGEWTRVPGCARDIDIGADGSVWVVGCADAFGGNALYRYKGNTTGTPSDTDWELVEGGAVKIAVGPTGLPWIVNDRSEIWRRTKSGKWQKIEGAASGIDVSPDGYAYVAGTTKREGGYALYLLAEQSELRYDDGDVAAPRQLEWVPMTQSGAGIDLAAGPNGLWVTNDVSEIWSTNTR